MELSAGGNADGCNEPWVLGFRGPKSVIGLLCLFEHAVFVVEGHYADSEGMELHPTCLHGRTSTKEGRSKDWAKHCTSFAVRGATR